MLKLTMPISEEEEPSPEAWLKDFQAKKGRPLRVLHVGNIANNAYLNAKMLRKIGVEADVLCHDYYHIMGCPEWEDAELKGHWGSDFAPDWKAAGIGRYRRPPWFYQGPLAVCAFLIANPGRVRRAFLHFMPLVSRPFASYVARVFQAAHFKTRAMSLRSHATSLRSRARSRTASVSSFLRAAVHLVLYPALLFVNICRIVLPRVLPRPIVSVLARLYRAGRMTLSVCGRMLSACGRMFSAGGRTLGRMARSAKASLLGARPLLGWTKGLRFQRRRDDADEDEDEDLNYDQWISRFAELYPDRPPLSIKDIDRNLFTSRMFRRIFARYDVVQCYGTTPIEALLAGKRPYVAFEHGTMRDIPFQNDPQGKLTALAYHEADHVYITNCDNVRAAERLRLRDFSFIPHPVNEEGIHLDPQAVVLRTELLRKHGADFILFHPARQHWTAERHPSWEKGNDFFIRGLAQFMKAANARPLCVCVEWGHTVAQSKALLEELGIADCIAWIPPQPNRAMVRYVLASDVVADQFFLGAFGSLTPKAMMCGRPVLLNLDEKLHDWAFAETPPVENVRNPEEIAAALTRLFTDLAYRQQRGENCRRWYWKYHSSQRITASHLAVYRKVIEKATRPSEG